ncbi:MAG: uridine kinase family protein [Opitutales bacterium]
MPAQNAVMPVWMAPRCPAALPWNADTAAVLLSAIDQRRSSIDRPYVVAVAGGSATGKSTQVAARLAEHLGHLCCRIEQDHFQQRSAVIDRLNPRYRWDDPLNYGLEACADLLERLRAGREATMPVYSFMDRRHTGTQTLEARPVILLDGLYAGHESLQPWIDMALYVETPLYGRLLRRLFRNQFERYRNADPARTLQGFLGPVLKAHREQVRDQRGQAHWILQNPYRFTESLQRFGLQPVRQTDPIRRTYALPAGLTLELAGNPPGVTVFRIRYADRLYFPFPVDPETADRLESLDLHEY